MPTPTEFYRWFIVDTCRGDASCTLREEVGRVVDVLHELSDLHGEMFVVVSH